MNERMLLSYNENLSLEISTAKFQRRDDIYLDKRFSLSK